MKTEFTYKGRLIEIADDPAVWLARRFPAQNLKHGQRFFRRWRLSTRIPVRDSRSLNAKHPGKFSLFNVVCYTPRFDVRQ